MDDRRDRRRDGVPPGNRVEGGFEARSAAGAPAEPGVGDGTSVGEHIQAMLESWLRMRAASIHNKLVKRVAFGMPNFAHYRIRSLLYAGEPNRPPLGTITPP